jgi:hypothetical protein
MFNLSFFMHVDDFGLFFCCRCFAEVFKMNFVLANGCGMEVSLSPARSEFHPHLSLPWQRHVRCPQLAPLILPKNPRCIL